MKNKIKYLLFLAIILLQHTACGSEEGKVVDNIVDGGEEQFEVLFELPASIDISQGEEYVFKVKNGKPPSTSDLFILESEDGITHAIPIIRVTLQNFTIRVDDELESGNYNVYIRRDMLKEAFGKTHVNIVKKIDFNLAENTRIYGIVTSSDGAPLKNVVVSDGVEVTVTDEDGIYQLNSSKQQGFVFISIPGGYEVSSNGVLPQFFHRLKEAPNIVERFDFTLEKINNQDSYKVFMLGDMHLANRVSDRKQFAEFTNDLKLYMNNHSGKNMYAIALGDMTWDVYWIQNNFFFPQYLNTVNSQLNLQIFHVMGNHDYDYSQTSDFTAEYLYRNHIGPTYYSFNIGEVHFVVLDNFDASEYDGTITRKIKKTIADEQLEWLVKDLSYVDKSTPIVIAMHAQVFYPTATGFRYDHDVNNTDKFFNILNGYEAHFVTGHLHKLFNVTPEDDITGSNNFYEHNSNAVCGSWWWSGHLTPGVNLSRDGSPGGYGIWDIDGTDIKWRYKATGWPEDYQFRSYDLNNVHFSMDDVPLMPSSVPTETRKVFEEYIDAYPENNDNEVLIKIWNWNSNWTLTVVDENGENLTVEEVWAYDPLHIAVLSVKRFNVPDLSVTPNFITERFTNFFKVQAKDADVDLLITVKDEFGNTWTEDMKRPRVFSIDEYLRK